MLPTEQQRWLKEPHAEYTKTSLWPSYSTRKRKKKDEKKLRFLSRTTQKIVYSKKCSRQAGREIHLEYCNHRVIADQDQRVVYRYFFLR